MTEKKNKVGILGGTGHIGKNLIYYFSKNNKYELNLFSRDVTSTKNITNEFKNINVDNYDKLNSYELDTVINCVGISNPTKILDDKIDFKKITDKYDEQVLLYLKKFSDSLYINISSGAVYGENFTNNVNEKSTITTMQEINPYAESKISIEKKHRKLSDNNIIDLRVFNFFSRYINLNTNFLLCQLVNAIKNKTIFITDSNDITRDFIHPSDLFNLIEKCIKKNTINDVFDVYSKKPISKFEIIDLFEKKYDLGFKITNNIIEISPTGVKQNYFSSSQKAGKIGYEPEFTSFETIQDEIKFLL
ncbi:NAD(P)-dependent oxidoreductase [Candidatus Nitrosopelagicus sp.]|nr:NAD(P)-dependent oxidoreductase [Candidatus Nitrosopelagicus sp.]